jgi:DNA-binding GntR family transcriptional regulator
MDDSPFDSLPKIRSRGPLAEKVYVILKKAIIDGTLAEGTWLQEESLTKALGVSRTPVREAINRLKSDGIIDVIPRKGAHIIELSDRELDELFEVREQIETTFFIRSAETIARTEVQRFRERLEESERAIRDRLPGSADWHAGRLAYLRSDRALHDSLVKAAGNTYWERLYLDIRDRIEICGNQLSSDQTWFDIAIRDHYSIIDAILVGQYEEGQRAMRAHIRNVREGIDRIRSAR